MSRIDSGNEGSALQKLEWRRSLRWFAAEFLVVVCGVLVALALQAWYNVRADARAERVYLQQLDADLDASQHMLRAAISEDSVREQANAKLIAALYRSGPLSVDSARTWLKWQLGYYSDPRPVMGTVTTLIGTGDIKLIRNPALRSQIVAYASYMATDGEELSRNVTRLSQANDAERRQWERNEIRPLAGAVAPDYTNIEPGAYSEADINAFVPQYLAAWPRLRADPELRTAYHIRLRAFSNRTFYLGRMLTSTNQLRTLLSQGS